MKLLIGAISFLLVLVFSAPAYLAQSVEEDEIISVDSSIVLMNAMITDVSGRAVRGLGLGSFRVFEDGVEQEITSFQAEETSFAAVILLDTSGSMDQRMSLARSAAIQFLDGLRTDDFAAIYKFDSTVELIQDFSNSRAISDRTFDLKADGMTVLNDAIFKAAQVLSKQSEARRAIIVLSDGADTKSSKTSDKALRAAMLANATVYTVDMSAPGPTGRERMQNQGALKKFADKTGGRFVATPGGVAMREAFQRIVEELGLQYTIAYQSKNEKKDGSWRAIELRVARPNLTIRTRKGYNAPKSQ